MLRVQVILLYILCCSTLFSNPIASIHLNQVLQSNGIFDGFEPSCQRIAKSKVTPNKFIEHCKLATRKLKKSLQRVQFKSNQTVRSILKDRHHLYSTQHKYKNISSELQKLSDRYQIATSNSYDQMVNEIIDFHSSLDQYLRPSYFSKLESDQILSQRYDQINKAIHHYTSTDEFQVLINHSKGRLGDFTNSFIENYQMPSGKNLFNYLLRSPNPKSMILLAALANTKPKVNAPKIYNEIADTTQMIKDQLNLTSSSGPKKVTVSSWRTPSPVKQVKKHIKSKKKTSLTDEFSSIFSKQSSHNQNIHNNDDQSIDYSMYGVVQLPVLLALHPEMQKFDAKTKRFIGANPQNFVQDGFFQGFRKKFLRTNVNNNSFEQLSQLQALESSRLLDIVNSEKQHKSIYRNIQQTVSKLVKKYNLKGIFYDNLRSSDVNSMILNNKIVVNDNINDLTKESLISLYANSDQQVLEKVIDALRKANLID
ncbi:MAG: hypothetical protein KC646_04370 [Candidatus Cloacimonetes bacterium]|nr:hypothetical protein [Candidatus Cloacimonadota bacterium]